MTAVYSERYKLILCDPPWSYRDKGNAGKRGASHKYNCLSLDEICALPVPDIAARDCLLALWWVPPMPAEALRCMQAWGFRMAIMTGFTWRKVGKPQVETYAEKIARAVRGQTYSQRYKTVKRLLQQMEPKEHFGLGRYSRGNTEHCLFAVRGRPKIIDHSVRQLINSPRLKPHSRKTPEARSRLVKMMGLVPRIELFATEQIEGWDALGLELDGRDIRASLPELVRRLQ